MDKPNYPNLEAVIINCTLKPSPKKSHTDNLLNNVRAIMDHGNVRHKSWRAIDLNIAPGIQEDMTESFPDDGWPELAKEIDKADILIVATPIWIGEESSICRRVLERLYGGSGKLNESGQSKFYNKVAGCVVTGNEDGVKHISMSVLYALSHIGFTIPPQADCGWIGEIGPGKSYGDQKDDGTQAGYDNDFTRKNTTIMTWNLLHLAHHLKQHPINNYGNDRNDWEDGKLFGHPVLPKND